MLLVAVLASTPAGKGVWTRLEETSKKLVLPVLLLLGLLISTCYLVDATYNPFLYFRF